MHLCCSVNKIISALHRRFEQELNQYKDRIVWKLIDLPGHDSPNTADVYNVLDVVHSTIEQESRGLKLKTGHTPTPNQDGMQKSVLIARIKKEGIAEKSVESFWGDFIAVKVAEWDHRNHLSAGYVNLREENGLFEAATTFLSHLQRLKASNPDRFRNTEHMTLTIFWLHSLQIAILKYKSENSVEGWPVGADFQDVFLTSPQLMFGGSWKTLQQRPSVQSRSPRTLAVAGFATTSGLQDHFFRRPEEG
jgi:ubiquitin carboxyl-terminal hydrolase L3